MSVTIARLLDLKWLAFPLPVVRTAQAIKELDSGDVIEVIATDPGSVHDIEAWCRSTHNELIEQSNTLGRYRYVIRKG